jgi:hypothetical protein
MQHNSLVLRQTYQVDRKEEATVWFQKAVDADSNNIGMLFP